METKIEKQRERVKETISQWSDQKKAKEVAFFRTKGFTCNNEEEIIDAYIGIYLDNGNFIYGIITVVLLVILLTFIF